MATPTEGEVLQSALLADRWGAWPRRSRSTGGLAALLDDALAVLAVARPAVEAAGAGRRAELAALLGVAVVVRARVAVVAVLGLVAGALAVVALVELRALVAVVAQLLVVRMRANASLAHLVGADVAVVVGRLAVAPRCRRVLAALVLVAGVLGAGLVVVADDGVLADAFAVRADVGLRADAAVITLVGVLVVLAASVAVALVVRARVAVVAQTFVGDAIAVVVDAVALLGGRGLRVALVLAAFADQDLAVTLAEVVLDRALLGLVGRLLEHVGAAVAVVVEAVADLLLCELGDALGQSVRGAGALAAAGAEGCRLLAGRLEAEAGGALGALALAVALGDALLGLLAGLLVGDLGAVVAGLAVRVRAAADATEAALVAAWDADVARLLALVAVLVGAAGVAEPRELVDTGEDEVTAGSGSLSAQVVLGAVIDAELAAHLAVGRGDAEVGVAVVVVRALATRPAGAVLSPARVVRVALRDMRVAADRRVGTEVGVRRGLRVVAASLGGVAVAAGNEQGECSAEHQGPVHGFLPCGPKSDDAHRERRLPVD